jgi:hypothetical protein
MYSVLAISLYKYFYGLGMFVIGPPIVVEYPKNKDAPLDNPSCLDRLQANPVDPFVIVAKVDE